MVGWSECRLLVRIHEASLEWSCRWVTVTDQAGLLVAVATLLPVLFIAAVVQLGSLRSRARVWILVIQSAPIVAGQVVALGALETGRANQSTIVWTVVASAGALVFFMITAVMAVSD